MPGTPSPGASGNRNALWARTLFDELARAGVRHIVVAPGSRSTPLVLAAAADPRFSCAVQVDERSAAFLALGVGKGTGTPAAVITTSGTAVANLLPAVVEASQAEVPLLLLTADRPPRLRGGDANQAIEQPHIFGPYARLFRELAPADLSDATLRHLRSVANQAVAAALGDPAGPVHLNLAFEKPLEPVPVDGDGVQALVEAAPLAALGRPDAAPFTRIYPRRILPPDTALDSLALRLAAARRPLLVVGPSARPGATGPAVAALARVLSAPFLADPLSGARTLANPAPSSSGPGAPGAGYDLGLRSAELRPHLTPDLVIRFGTTPSSASLASWLDELRHVPQVVVDAGHRWKDHLAVASDMLPGDPAGVALALARRMGQGDATAPDPGWAGRWRRLDGAVQRGVHASLEEGLAEGAAALAALAHAASGTLFVSNSMPIRDVDALWPVGVQAPAGGPVQGGAASEPPAAILGNRGASGIDGIVSTALGVAWGTGRPVTALVGDLALIHDMNGLLRASGVNAPGDLKVDFVAVNNDGGGIFHLLPVREHDPPFTRFVATPHGLEPERIAALHGLPFRRVEGRGVEGQRVEGPDRATAPDLAHELTAGLEWAREHPGSVILEIRTDREENRRQHGRLVERVLNELRALATALEREQESRTSTPS